MSTAEHAYSAGQSPAAATPFERPGALHPAHDLLDYAKHYAREKPEVVALWCFGIGFILGWKLKPW